MGSSYAPSILSKSKYSLFNKTDESSAATSVTLGEEKETNGTLDAVILGATCVIAGVLLCAGVMNMGEKKKEEEEELENRASIVSLAERMRKLEGKMKQKDFA